MASVNIRTATFDDFHNISVLIKQSGDIMWDKNPEQWIDIWKSNPAYQAVKETWPIGWVLETDKKKIVGFLGNIPVAYEFGGSRITAAVMSTGIVDPSFRNSSILLFSNYFAQKTSDFFIDSTANYAASKIFSAFKGDAVPAGSYDAYRYWIVNYKKFASGLAGNTTLTFFLKKASFLLPVLRAIDGVKRISLYGRENGDIRLLPDFDERFDAFWRELKARSKGLLCVRDSDTLKWHFKYAIRQNRVWIFAEENGRSIKSYAIFLKEDNQGALPRRVFLVDFQTLNEDSGILKRYITMGLERCRIEDADLMGTIGFWPKKIRAIQRTVSYTRRPKHPCFLYKANDVKLSRALKDPYTWEPSLYDGDGSL